jgi:PEP phosphonomutase and related enzymes
MNAPDRLRKLLAEPGLVVMPAVWGWPDRQAHRGGGLQDGVPVGSCVAASRLGGPDLDLISFGEMFDSFNMVHGAAPDCWCWRRRPWHGNAMNVQRTVRAYGRPAPPPC